MSDISLLNMQINTNGAEMDVEMAGVIDEHATFQDIGGDGITQINIDLEKINRITSDGVRNWLKRFLFLEKEGAKFSFRKCSTAVVAQMNQIINFNCGGTIESIFAPFNCEKCGLELQKLYSTEELKKDGLDSTSYPKCTKCNGQVAFDDIPAEFFNFLKR